MKELAVGIDIGGTHTVFGLVDQSGNCLVQDKIYTKEFDTFSDFLITLSDQIKKLQLPNKESFKLSGIGVGAPNANYMNGTIENASNLIWEGVLPLGNLLQRNFNLPVKITNDANASAMAEMLYGGAKGMKNFIVLTLGTGLGSGIVVDSKVVYGHSGFAGELGHIIARPEGRQCGCGRYGCLETYVSATGIKRTVSKLLAKYSFKSDLRGIPFNRMSAKKLADAAYRGDEIAIESFEYTGKILGIALANVVAINNPQAIFLAGGLSKAGDLILKPTQHHMEENLLSVYKGKTILSISKVKGNSGILGSAAMIWNLI
ncbi:ROK family protein [Marinifilum caeruleilacunae]|jgi:glucokinase|uniref:ROK family protein n=1 Tax=Marinifilum caeruleilacunae TaxID=2499076 RepID=A0ABX1WUW7_9BACT|nr:ROK family protein [Marinifilum caeruleilacunae]NOU59811.1 ROK family protein [Marinifilum caeruleilacunae]